VAVQPRKRGENLLQNDILHVFRFSQLSRWKVRI